MSWTRGWATAFWWEVMSHVRASFLPPWLCPDSLGCDRPRNSQAGWDWISGDDIRNIRPTSASHARATAGGKWQSRPAHRTMPAYWISSLWEPYPPKRVV